MTRASPHSRNSRARLAAQLLLALLPFAADATAAPLVLNNPTDAPLTTPAGDGFLDRLAREAFRRAGAEVTLVKLPAERGLLNANAGIDDGDLNRIAGLESAYPNLVRVPEKSMDMRFSAFTRMPALRAASWQQLQPYRVGIIRGWKILEVNLGGVNSVLHARDVAQLFDLLAHDRADLVLYAEMMGLAHARARAMSDLRMLQPPLVSREMFIYLHKKHAALVPALAAALKAMKEDGTYARFYRDTAGTLK